MVIAYLQETGTAAKKIRRDEQNLNTLEEGIQWASSNRVTLRERVSIIGYPLQSILGSNPKFSAKTKLIKLLILERRRHSSPAT
jgi:hypothetical protein